MTHSDDPKFLVTVTTVTDGKSCDFFLRGTVWSFALERATLYDSREAAQKALDAAAQFMKKKTYKAARIEPASNFNLKA